MKNCSCPVCYEHQSANEYYRMTVHTNEYHKLIEKIYKEKESLQSKIGPNHFEDCVKLSHDFETHQEIEFAISELESLLENK